ncbi:mersacidin/lichenicidin family type 2 lantibiotic [Archangium lansingense]|uniref:Mersacidin/lichenicidin family type 2 lantibiotic n=1 Tax=Archangium lansingense TaxID=2995310 RepID=A0ABT4A6D5_9BACT|nr:mersacidin/lichenicidin family type 2 lantibiotic [Archangium lansinium]MCY1077221.1 mersacidin/lichenicidin family type 2 lantibiotic [Archangium lansinium]
MKKEWIVRAWKDPAFRASLSAEERASLPESPSGKALTELDEEALLGITGGLRAVVPATGCTGPEQLTCGIIACCPAPEPLEVM